VVICNRYALLITGSKCVVLFIVITIIPKAARHSLHGCVTGICYVDSFIHSFISTAVNHDPYNLA